MFGRTFDAHALFGIRSGVVDRHTAYVVDSFKQYVPLQVLCFFFARKETDLDKPTYPTGPSTSFKGAGNPPKPPCLHLRRWTRSRPRPCLAFVLIVKTIFWLVLISFWLLQSQKEMRIFGLCKVRMADVSWHGKYTTGRS